MTRIFAFEDDGTLMQSEGGFTEYLEHGGVIPGAEDAVTSFSNNDNSSNNPSVTSRVSSRDTWKQPRTKKRLSYNEQREYDALPDEIDALESRIAELEEEMTAVATDYAKLAALSQEKEEADKLLETKMERYLDLQDMVDSFT